MRKIIIIDCLVLTIIFMGVLLVEYQRHLKYKDIINSVTVSDTTIVYDTVTYTKPIPVDSTVIRFQIKKFPVFRDSVRITDSVAIDTMHFQDSVSIRIPITQKEYKDSTYHAWVSGYLPCLDSISVYQKTTTINTVRYKKKNWGAGVQTGIGVTKDGVQPYIGVGVHYNVFSW